MSADIEIINLTGRGISKPEARQAAKWIAEAFEYGPAPPTLTIFSVPYRMKTTLNCTRLSGRLISSAVRVMESFLELETERLGSGEDLDVSLSPGKGGDHM